MYVDYILFAIGGSLLLIAVILSVYLLASKKKYDRLLREESQRVDVMSTLRSTYQLNTENSSKSYAAVVEEHGKERPVDSTRTLPNHAAEGVRQNITEVILVKPAFTPDATELLPGNDTESMPLNSSTTLNKKLDSMDVGIDLSCLEGRYELLREIHGGGMSHIFLARHIKLGNEWIVKYVDGSVAELANEADILKKLNHISLPQIIDIFQTPESIFFVERYIEGYTLEQVLQLGQDIRESLVYEWGLQLAQVLNYLHTLETPIIHCDMKPSNIMVTYDDRLVLIDFGISKRQGNDDGAAGLTYRYAAPEQFKGNANMAIARQRFGTLPENYRDWPIDSRTDIYSVGVILYELLVGDVPQNGDFEKIRNLASPELANAICKCLQLDPTRRFQSARELAEALEKVKVQRQSMTRSLVLRKVIAAAMTVAIVGGVSTSASAVAVNRNENLAVIDIDPGRAVVTVQQSVQIIIQKTMPNGKEIQLDSNQIEWSYSDENIARLDGDKLIGLNVGEVTLNGIYRSKEISLDITVTEPVEEKVSVSLRYADGVNTSIYAGNGQRETKDGDLDGCSFVSPEYISADSSGVYLSDSGVIRILEDGYMSSLHLEPAYLTANIVKGHNGSLYILTGPWETEGGDTYYGFVRIADGAAEMLYYTDAVWSSISDFAFSSNGMMWFIQQNLGTGSTTLNKLDLETLKSAWVMDLPDYARGMAFDSDDTLFISVPEQGIILRIGDGESEWSYFAGVEGERHFVDGAISNFYRPTSIAAHGGFLYVLDFDTVRRIAVEGGAAAFTDTLAGIPTADTNPSVKLGTGVETVLPASELASLAVTEECRLLLTDPKNSVIYEIGLPE